MGLDMKTLILIPARGGSKRLPHKNTMFLDGKPLIQYTIECARQIADDIDICVSTDSSMIKDLVTDLGLHIPFLRPPHLATDTASTNDVVVHALEYYKSQGRVYDCVILMQPTSPLRKASQVKEALALYNEDIEMVVSVKESHCPAVLCQENEEGFLEMTFNKTGNQSQLFSAYFEYNGAIYIFNVKSLLANGLHNITKKIKYIMDDYSSFDIDNETDFQICESLLKQKSS